MYDFAVTWDWIEFVVRWLHVVTAIVWIGTSFYFIALDLGLRKGPNLPEGVQWRGMAGARRWILPRPEIPRRSGTSAGAPDLVQVGELFDLDFRRRLY